MGLFKKKITKPKTGLTQIKPLDYPGRVILVWGEAISGKREHLDVLLKSEYKELGLFVHAMHNQDGARAWLMENGFPHLVAMLNAVEGKKDARLWLKAHKFNTLYHMAMCADGDKGSFAWLISNDKKDMAMIAKKIEFVKNYIEEGNNDIHSISI